jgi:hypothetical protein
MTLKIYISTIPHAIQRYNTCGDYYMVHSGFTHEPTLALTVSKMADWRMEFLVAIHELVEYGLTQHEAIPLKAIDDFDLFWEEAKLKSEPGDSLAAPYYHAHQFASGIERLLAAELGVDWAAYEAAIKNLSSTQGDSDEH